MPQQTVCQIPPDSLPEMTRQSARYSARHDQILCQIPPDSSIKVEDITPVMYYIIFSEYLSPLPIQFGRANLSAEARVIWGSRGVVRERTNCPITLSSPAPPLPCSSAPLPKNCLPQSRCQRHRSYKNSSKPSELINLCQLFYQERSQLLQLFNTDSSE